MTRNTFDTSVQNLFNHRRGKYFSIIRSLLFLLLIITLSNAQRSIEPTNTILTPSENTGLGGSQIEKEQPNARVKSDSTSLPLPKRSPISSPSIDDINIETGSPKAALPVTLSEKVSTPVQTQVAKRPERTKTTENSPSTVKDSNISANTASLNDSGQEGQLKRTLRVNIDEEVTRPELSLEDTGDLAAKTETLGLQTINEQPGKVNSRIGPPDPEREDLTANLSVLTSDIEEDSSANTDGTGNTISSDSSSDVPVIGNFNTRENLNTTETLANPSTDIASVADNITDGSPVSAPDLISSALGRDNFTDLALDTPNSDISNRSTGTFNENVNSQISQDGIGGANLTDLPPAGDFRLSTTNGSSSVLDGVIGANLTDLPLADDFRLSSTNGSSGVLDGIPDSLVSQDVIGGANITDLPPTGDFRLDTDINFTEPLFDDVIGENSSLNNFDIIEPLNTSSETSAIVQDSSQTTLNGDRSGLDLIQQGDIPPKIQGTEEFLQDDVVISSVKDTKIPEESQFEDIGTQFEGAKQAINIAKGITEPELAAISPNDESRLKTPTDVPKSLSEIDTSKVVSNIPKFAVESPKFAELPVKSSVDSERSTIDDVDDDDDARTTISIAETEVPPVVRPESASQNSLPQINSAQPADTQNSAAELVGSEPPLVADGIEPTEEVADSPNEPSSSPDLEQVNDFKTPEFKTPDTELVKVDKSVLGSNIGFNPPTNTSEDEIYNPDNKPDSSERTKILRSTSERPGSFDGAGGNSEILNAGKQEAEKISSEISQKIDSGQLQSSQSSESLKFANIIPQLIGYQKENVQNLAPGSTLVLVSLNVPCGSVCEDKNSEKDEASRKAFDEAVLNALLSAVSDGTGKSVNRDIIKIVNVVGIDGRTLVQIGIQPNTIIKLINNTEITQPEDGPDPSEIIEVLDKEIQNPNSPIRRASELMSTLDSNVFSIEVLSQISNDNRVDALESQKTQHGIVMGLSIGINFCLLGLFILGWKEYKKRILADEIEDNKEAKLISPSNIYRYSESSFDSFHKSKYLGRGVSYLAEDCLSSTSDANLLGRSSKRPSPRFEMRDSTPEKPSNMDFSIYSPSTLEDGFQDLPDSTKSSSFIQNSGLRNSSLMSSFVGDSTQEEGEFELASNFQNSLNWAQSTEAHESTYEGSQYAVNDSDIWDSEIETEIRNSISQFDN